MDLLPLARQQFCDQNGVPFAGGTVEFYTPGTTAEKDTFADQAGTAPNPNPVVLDSAGRATIWGRGDYRQVLRDAAGNLIWDGVVAAAFPDSGVSDFWRPLLATTSLTQWMTQSGLTDSLTETVDNIQLLPGPTGPAGPQGPIGPTGPAGPAGATGSDGASAAGTVVWVQTGSATSDVWGNVLWTYPTPYAHAALIVNVVLQSNPDGAEGWFWLSNGGPWLGQWLLFPTDQYDPTQVKGAVLNVAPDNSLGPPSSPVTVSITAMGY